MNEKENAEPPMRLRSGFGSVPAREEQALTAGEQEMLRIMAITQVLAGQTCWHGSYDDLNSIGGLETLQSLQQKGKLTYTQLPGGYQVSIFPVKTPGENQETEDK